MSRFALDKNLIYWLVGVGLFLAALVIVIFLILLARRRRQGNESHLRSELVAMERETQFAAAVEQLPYLKNHQEITREIAAIFADYLSMRLLAVYAAPEKEERLSNIMPATNTVPPELQDSPGPIHLPDTVPASLLREYWRPQVATLENLTGNGGAGSPPANISGDWM